MTVVALVTSKDDIPSIVSWSVGVAASLEANLQIVVLGAGEPYRDVSRVRPNDNAPLHALTRIAWELADQMNHGRQSPVEFEIHTVCAPSPTRAVLAYTKGLDARFVLAAFPTRQRPASLADRSSRLLLKRARAELLLISTNRTRPLRATHTLAIASGSADVREILWTIENFRAPQGDSTVAVLEEDLDEHAAEVARRQLDRYLKDADIDPDNTRFEKLVIQDLSALHGISQVANNYSLIVFGAGNIALAEQVLAETQTPTIAIHRRPLPLNERRLLRYFEWLPELLPGGYADLVHNVREGSRFGADYVLMLVTSVAIASLGLLQNSAAVIIGSMLLAPLMMPIMGLGLSLATASRVLLRRSLVTIGVSIPIALTVAAVVGLLTPGGALTPELLGRAQPNILDLGIALFSAIAGAYALARPGIAASIAGVAIATALIPPLSAAGIALADERPTLFIGSFVLFLTNLVAIALGAATLFWLMGASISTRSHGGRRWVRTITVSLAALMLAVTPPLILSLRQQLRIGRQPVVLTALTHRTVFAIEEVLAKYPGAHIVSSYRRADKNTIQLILSAQPPLPRTAAAAIAHAVRLVAGKNVGVKILSLPHSWVMEAKP